jgi:lambda family phage portal protein
MAKRSSSPYVGAQMLSRFNFGLNGSGSADYELQNSLKRLRDRSRQLAKNSPMARRYQNLLRTNVVGASGFILQSQVMKLDNTFDEALNTTVEKEWADFWANPTVDGCTTGVQLLKQAVTSWSTDGEVIWELVDGRNYARHNMAINPIEADMLDESLTIARANGNQIRMGVEIAPSGLVVAYWFLTQHPGDVMVIGHNHSSERHRRVDADHIIHVFEKRRPGQTRGEPPFAPVIGEMKLLDGYQEAEVIGRRLKSALMIFLTRMLPKAEGIEKLATGYGGTADEQEALEMQIEPGRITQLPDGLEPKEFSPGGSVSDFAQTVAQFKISIATGLNISTTALGMEVAGVSYSTMRSVLIEDRDYYRELQMFFITGLMQRTFQKWVSSRSLSAETNIPPTRVPKVKESFVFRGRGWAWVDPMKDVKANELALTTSQTTLTKVLAGQGVELPDHIADLKAEMAAFRTAGLRHPLEPDTPAVNAPQGAVSSNDSQVQE